ncbi:hypothetical protein Tco_1176515 [Tanacetum coccineum]
MLPDDMRRQHRLEATSSSLTLDNLLAARSGYMSLEYASDGVFLIKSGVFSFGVLVLDITAILPGFASLNDHVDKRMAELNQHAEENDRVLARIGEEAL